MPAEQAEQIVISLRKRRLQDFSELLKNDANKEYFTSEIFISGLTSSYKKTNRQANYYLYGSVGLVD